MKSCKIFLLFFIFSGCQTIAFSQQSFETYYEKSGFKETPRYDKTIRYCKQLAQASPWVHYTRFGISPQGRELPLLVVDKNGNFDPASVKNSRNAVVMIQACIHAGEPDGKDAGLMLIRDIVIQKKYQELLDNVTLLFIPIFNVDGHERFGGHNRINQNGPSEMGWRTNAQNLNLNRDYLKAEAAEMKNWIALFLEWLPDFFIDCHVTDGADYQYALTYSLENTGSMEKDLTDWQNQNFLRPVEAKMKESGFPIIHYVAFRNWHDPRSGMASWASPPMFSQGYTAMLNRPGLLIETHMLKDYQTRVTATYEMLRHSIDVVNKESRKLTGLIREADVYTGDKLRLQPFPVSYENSKNDSVMIDFLGIDYTVEKSDLTGGNWFKYGDVRKTFKVPFFNKVVPNIKVQLPEAYLVPPEWTEVIAKINLHGIHTSLLQKEIKLKVGSYKFHDLKYRQNSFEGRQTVTFKCDTIWEERTFPQGTVIVDMNQPKAKIIAYLLEPEAASSLASWGYFNTVFEQKEYAESYVMEVMARDMLKNDAALQKEFTEKMEKEPQFAGNPQEILNWFYRRSVYWDKRINVYPVGKVFDRKVADNLKN
ncbi:MAG: M14 family metallopeptidase [Bacteroidales bacterium]